MSEHLNNILKDLEMLVNNEKYEFSMNDVNYIKKNINFFLNLQAMEKIDFEILKEVANKIYDLNLTNSFCALTDHISNELYAFEFLLQKSLERRDK